MSTPTFAETHNLVAFLEKPSKSKGFEHIIDFNNDSSIKYALTMNPTIYTSSLVDGKKIIVNKASIRRDLRLDDAKGTACLPNATIFEELARMGRKQRKEAEVPQDEIQYEESVLDLEEAKTAQAKEIASLKRRVKKLENRRMSRTTEIKRLKKVGIATKVESSKDVASVGDQEDASKQGRMIDNINQDVEITLVDEAQEKMNDQNMFGVNDLDGDEVIVDDTAGEKEE
ncbi:hypothetical protein Tco_1541834 [Tanacetum coccineum]